MDTAIKVTSSTLYVNRAVTLSSVSPLRRLEREIQLLQLVPTYFQSNHAQKREKMIEMTFSFEIV